MVEDSLASKSVTGKTIVDPKGLYQINKGGQQNSHSYCPAVLNYSSTKKINNQCIVLKPLDPSRAKRNKRTQPSQNVTENLVSDKQYYTSTDDKKSNRKCFQSKIPVLKSRTKLPPLSNKNVQNALYDSTLSAADRRQKFQQSRLRVGCPDVTLRTIEYCKILPASPAKAAMQCMSGAEMNSRKLQKIILNRPPERCLNSAATNLAAVPVKNVLPAVIKNIPVTTSENIPVHQGKKKKSMTGEFTHFPALCNISHVRPLKKSYVSSVPHLPPILPPPAAPPPSVSASLEQEVK